MLHKPVLPKEVVEALDLRPGSNVIDGTVGQAGYAPYILEKTGPNGKLLGIDWDAKQVENAKETTKEFGTRMVLAQGSYADMQKIASEQEFSPVNGILLDLGFSSWQLDESGRGFSFQKDELLDMRYDPGNEVSASEIVNEWPEEEIANIIFRYGEEHFSRRIAKKIVEERKKQRIESTFQLAEIIKDATPSWYWHRRIHYATKTFQGLRIAVNKELDNIKEALPKLVELLEPGGRLVVISFHSLEDREVKQFMREWDKEEKIKIITKKPVQASLAEKHENPRARSAKLRTAQKL
jgi:16S rRNA (cytosine1402-N4)-methyltransferase